VGVKQRCVLSGHFGALRHEQTLAIALIDIYMIVLPNFG